MCATSDQAMKLKVCMIKILITVVPSYTRKNITCLLPLLCCTLVTIQTASLCLLFSSSSLVTIGFDATAYTFTETDSTVSRSVSVSVQSGSLARDVVVTVQTMDGTATGGFSYTHTHTHFVDVSFMFFLPPQLITQLCPFIFIISPSRFV